MQQGSASSGAAPLHSALHPRIRPAEEAPFRPGALAAALRQPHQNHYHYNFAPRPSATGPAYGSASSDAVAAEWEQQRRRLLDGGGDPNEDDATAGDGNWAKAWAIARWVMLVLVIGLVIVGVTMLAQVFDRVGKVMEMMSSSEATGALQDALAHAHATTANIENGFAERGGDDGDGAREPGGDGAGAAARGQRDGRRGARAEQLLGAPVDLDRGGVAFGVGLYYM